MSTIPLLARRRLCNTFNAQEVGQLRAALQDAGVSYYNWLFNLRLFC